MEYVEWKKFEKVISKTKETCKKSVVDINYHFVHVDKMIKIPKNATKTVGDYKLSRYACYLIVQSGDPRKEVIALGQTYFVIQTRK